MKRLFGFLLAMVAVSLPAQTTIYSAVNDKWTSNTSASVNSVASDSYTATIDGANGFLAVVNQASKEMAGGLVSDNLPLPANAKYFALDVVFDISQQDLAHYARGENDLKVTFAGGLQANGSCQWNADKGDWQLDPDGKGWIDTGYTEAPIAGRNILQLRLWSDGVTKWSVIAMHVNGDALQFTPDPTKFANLPMIKTNWAAGLHPQLQTEVKTVPWILREEYETVRVMASDSPIPWSFDL